MGTTLFDDAIHEFPANADKPQIFIQDLQGYEVYIHLTLTPEKWSNYPVRAMMVLYNTDTTNDASSIGSTAYLIAKASFSSEVYAYSSSYSDKSNFVWDRNTNLPVLQPIFQL